ncbi:MAG: CPBP family glutamic-type intramembrane protease [Armatimonadota bacterium]
MSYHPAIGDIREQRVRVAIIAALLVAALTLIGLNVQFTSLPSERWYRLSRQQAMEADLLYRLGDALERLAGSVTLPLKNGAEMLTERAVALWERRTLSGHPTSATAWRLGVIYGHRGYGEQAADMLSLAASLDEADSAFYHALAEVYSRHELDAARLRAHAARIGEHEGWLVEIALADCYRRLGDEAAAAEVASRQHTRAMRFLLSFAAIALTGGLLVVTGVVTLVVLALRRGLSLPRAEAPLPFLVPWTLIDIAEAVAVLIFAMVAGGVLLPPTVGTGAGAPGEREVQALIFAAQYLLVATATVGLIVYRVRRRSSRPLRVLGMRFRGMARLVAIGVAGYAVFVTLLMALTAALSSLLGPGGLPLAQTTEEIVGAARSPGEVALYLVLVGMIAPIVEETIFRGYVYGGLRRFLSPRRAIIAGGVVFAAAHLNAESFLMVGLIGAMLCYLYERTRSLVPGMVAHGLHNGLVLVVMLMQSM